MQGITTNFHRSTLVADDGRLIACVETSCVGDEFRSVLSYADRDRVEQLATTYRRCWTFSSVRGVLEDVANLYGGDIRIAPALTVTESGILLPPSFAAGRAGR